jgi:cytochrome c-type biogenesis protein CcmH/NrfF
MDVIWTLYSVKLGILILFTAVVSGAMDDCIYYNNYGEFVLYSPAYSYFVSVGRLWAFEWILIICITYVAIKTQHP